MRVLSLGLYLLGLFFIFLFGNELSEVNENVYYHLVNASLFLFVIPVSFLLLLSYSKVILRFLSNKSNLLYSLVVSVFAIWFSYFYLGDQIQGRYLNYSLILTDNFDHYFSLLDYVRELESRSYQKVLYDLYQYTTKIGVTPEALMAISRTFGVGVLIAVFFLSIQFLKDPLISFLSVVTFASSKYGQYILSSFEYGTPSMLFFILSMAFLVRLLEEDSKQDFILSVLFFTIASFFRYEILLLAGVPYFAVLTLGTSGTKIPKSVLLGLALFLIFRSIPFASHVVSGRDVYLHGKSLEPGLFTLLTNVFNVASHNINQGDLSFYHGAISFFTYSFLIIFGLSAWKRLNKTTLSLGVISLSYFLGTFFFHIEGMRSGQKYAVFYFACEIVITYRYLVQLKHGRILCLSFFIISYVLNPLLNFRLIPPAIQIEAIEYKDLKETGLDYSCYIIRLQDTQPIINYMFPMKFNTYYLEDLNEVQLEKKCFYYLDQRYVKYPNNTGQIKKDLFEIEKIFEKCDTKKEMDADLYTLYKYQC